MNSKLKAYLDSGGTSAPSPPANSTQCTFCDKPHNGVQMFAHLSSPTFDRSIALQGQFACDVCQEEVYKMEDTFVGSVTSPRKELPLYYLHTKDEKMLEFIDNGRYSDEVHMFYVDGLSHPMKDHCYFCANLANAPYANRAAYGYGKVKRLPVPVNHDSRLTGGEVNVCEKCWNTLSTAIGRTAAKHSDPWKWITNRLTSEICEDCASVYYVTTREYEMRHYLGTVGKHKCPHCTYHTLDALYGAKGPMVQLLVHGSGMDERIAHKNCAHCGDKFEADKTWGASILQKHLSDAGPTCESCKYKGYVPDIILRNEEGTARLFFFKDDNGVNNSVMVVMTPKTGKVTKQSFYIQDVVSFKKYREFINTYTNNGGTLDI